MGIEAIWEVKETLNKNNFLIQRDQRKNFGSLVKTVYTSTNELAFWNFRSLK